MSCDLFLENFMWDSHYLVTLVCDQLKKICGCKRTSQITYKQNLHKLVP